MALRLLNMEIRRALHRRLVWGLIAIAVLAILTTGVISYVASAGLDLTTVPADQVHVARLADWWRPDIGDGVLLLPAIMLFLGALIGGASVVGAEWRTGGVTTVLTWEPRRHRLLLTRLASAGALAAAIGFALEVLFLLSLLPTVLAHGTTTGADAAYLASVLGAMARIALLTGLAAVLGAALAGLGRNTTAALVAVWGWLLVGEGLVRALRPHLARFLLSENVGIFVTSSRALDVSYSRPAWLALATLVLYTGLTVGLGAVVFARRDIP
jgi:hypothetical protein